MNRHQRNKFYKKATEFLNTAARSAAMCIDREEVLNAARYVYRLDGLILAYSQVIEQIKTDKKGRPVIDFQRDEFEGTLEHYRFQFQKDIFPAFSLLKHIKSKK